MDATYEHSLFLIGCNHKTAPIKIRERFSISKLQKSELYKAFKNLQGLKECMILNTCNRVEFYGVGNSSTTQHDLLNQFYQLQTLNPKDFEPHQYRFQNEQVLKHLFQVTSGVNSQLIGETEILGQVKASYQEAQEYAMAGKILHQAMQKSFQAAKWVRTHTCIGSGQVSIGSVTTDLALRMFDDLRDVRILIIGSGEVAESTLHSLVHRGANDIVVANRTFEKAHQLAEKIGGMAIDFEHFPSQIHHFDIIITSTSADKVIITEHMLKIAQELRNAKPLFLIDLAVPRNITPLASELENTYMYNVDDLAQIANQNINARKSEIDKCLSILEDKALSTWKKLTSFRAFPEVPFN